jgi:hypothetical protein
LWSEASRGPPAKVPLSAAHSAPKAHGCDWGGAGCGYASPGRTTATLSTFTLPESAGSRRSAISCRPAVSVSGARTTAQVSQDPVLGRATCGPDVPSTATVSERVTFCPSLPKKFAYRKAYSYVPASATVTA